MISDSYSDDDSSDATEIIGTYMKSNLRKRYFLLIVTNIMGNCHMNSFLKSMRLSNFIIFKETKATTKQTRWELPENKKKYGVFYVDTHSFVGIFYIYTFTFADFYIYFLHSSAALPISMILQDEMKSVKDKYKANTTKSLGLNTDTTDYYFNLVLLGQYLLTI